MGTRSRTLLGICMLTALGASGCSNSRQLSTESSTPDTSNGSAVTGSSVDDTSPTTSDEVSSTSEPGDGPTTTVAAVATTTSTVEPSTDPATTVASATTTTTPVRHGSSEAPIVVVSGLGVLGWWDGTAWVDSDAMTPDIPVANGVDFSAFTSGTDVHHARSTGIDLGCEPSGGYTVVLDPGVFFDPIAASYAVNADWNLFPRPVEDLDPDNAEYREIVRQQIVADGLADPDVRIDQLIRTDLDGDGSDEVLIAASNPGLDLGLPAPAGGFSIVLIRQVIGGTVRTTALNQDVHLVADEDGQLPSTAQFGFGPVADFNGDGRAEVTVWGSFWEGALDTIYDVDPAAELPQPVLQAGCGS